MKHVFVFLALVASFSSSALAQAAGGVAPSEPRFHVLRSVSGSSGSEQAGRYVVQDPRSIFYLPADKHVIVYFEWEGPVGNHHFEGFWKNPEGKVVVMSDFSYAASQKRFGGYWSLDLSDGMAAGMWALEARVDGELTGSHTFQIISGEKPPTTTVPERQPQSPAEVYKQAQASTAFVDALDTKGQRIRSGSAFFVAPGLAVTAFQIVDGAASVRFALPDGRRTETNQIAAYNRLQDWAVLRLNGNTPPALHLAKAKSWSVGDRCFSFEVPTEGNRVIVDENITGMHTFPEVGDRLNVSAPSWTSAIGSPVLNEYGDVIGLLGGSTHPGTHREDGGLTMAALREGGMVTPIDAVKILTNAASDVTLEDLQRAGAFVAPMSTQSDLLWGGLSNHFDIKKNEFPTSRDSKAEFSRADRTCEVLLIWNPRTKLRGLLTFRLYDIANHMLVESQASKFKGDAGQYLTSKWGFSISDLKLSEYRVDAFLGDAPVWRGFFRVVE